VHVARLSGASSDIIKMLIGHDKIRGREQSSVIVFDAGFK